MASEKITAIIESVKGLTVLELKELIDTYCERPAPCGADLLMFKKER